MVESMFNKTTNYAVLLYAVLIMFLGYWGYSHGASAVSGYMGLGFGAALLLSALFMFAHQKWAAYLAVILTLILTVTFGIRYSMTYKQLPAIMAVLSGGMLLFLLAKTAKWKS